MKRLLGLLTFLAIAFSGHATHITGGDIQYRFIGDSTGIAHQYEVTLRVYRDCSPTASTIISGGIVISSSCYPNQNVTLPQVMGPLAYGEFTPPTYEDCVVAGTVKCQAIRLFKGVVTLPGTCSDFVFSYQDCCRPGGVSNLNNSNGQWFYFEAKLNNFLGNNSSAKFVSEPARAFCVGQNFNWSQAVVELDGDSLKYELISCRGLNGAPLTYNAGYTPLQPMITQPIQSFVLDHKTGIMNFTPNAVGTIVIALEVQEYRFDSTYAQWVQIGSSNRELVAAIAGTCSPQAMMGVKLDLNHPDIYIDPDNGLPTVNYKCLDSSVTLHFAVKLDCSTISPDGTDFRLTAPTGQPIPIKEIIAQCDVNNETSELELHLHKPLAANGNYFLYSKDGNDGNTLLNKCGFPMEEFDTIQLHVDSCFQTNIDLKNVTIVDDEFPKIDWLLDTIGTPNAPFPKFLVDEYNIYRSDDNGVNYQFLYSVKNYKEMTFNDKSLDWEDVDAQSYKYRVGVVINGLTDDITRDVHSIWLRTANGLPIWQPADSINLVWNSYNGWPNPDYTVYLGKKNSSGTWDDVMHDPTGSIQNPTKDSTYLMTNQFLQPGDYRVCVLAEYPNANGTGPFEAWSNCIPFTIYDAEIPPIDTPIAVTAPNVITPNGDAVNDNFIVENIDTWNTTRSVKIFNRWGRLVYESGSYSNKNPWTGKDNSGKLLADGVYFYMIEVYDQPSGYRDNLHGEVTIIGSSN